jgi:hypothetical protein
MQGKPIPGNINRIEGLITFVLHSTSMIASADQVLDALGLRTDARFLLIVEDHASFMRCTCVLGFTHDFHVHAHIFF